MFTFSRTASAFASALFVLAVLAPTTSGFPAIPPRPAGSAVNGVRAAPPPPQKPNIVVFYIDDMQPNDGRLWDDPDITPNLYNLFVAHGIHFDNAIGETPLCCPSRTTLLTGLHTHNTGVTLNNAALFNPGETVAKELQKSGYDTMIVGKYLNKVYPFSDAQWLPHEAGWSSMDVFQNDQRLVPDRYYYHYDIRQIGGTVTHYDEPHSTQFVTDTAITRLQQVPAGVPDFLLLTPYTTHAPDIPMPQFVGDPRCANMPPWDPPSYNQADVSSMPAYVRNHVVNNLPAAGYPMVQFCESMLGIDWMVGRVVSELTAEGRIDNTLFMFTADNGMTWGEHRLPLNKDTPYATPVPLYMHWSARWGNKPLDINEYVSDIDFAPTFCDVGGCTLGPYPTGQTKPDGLSLLPLLDGTVSNLGRDALLQENWEVPWASLRTTPENPLGLWHYVEWRNGDRELYDIANDPWELTNLAHDSQYANIVSALSQRLQELVAEGKASSPGTIKVVQDSEPNASSDFHFSGSLGSFALDDDSNKTLPRSRSFSGLSAGDYTIAQTQPAGWTLSSITCPPGSTVDVASGTVTVHLTSSQVATCTFTDVRHKPDASIALSSTGPFKGTNRFSAKVLKSQTLKRTGVAAGAEYDFWVQIRNVGKVTEPFSLKADVTDAPSMSVAIESNSVDVTLAVTAGTFTTASLAPGASQKLLLRVLVSPSAQVGDKSVVVFHAASVSEPTSVDVVRAITTH